MRWKRVDRLGLGILFDIIDVEGENIWHVGLEECNTIFLKTEIEKTGRSSDLDICNLKMPIKCSDELPRRQLAVNLEFRLTECMNV